MRRSSSWQSLEPVQGRLGHVLDVENLYRCVGTHLMEIFQLNTDNEFPFVQRNETLWKIKSMNFRLSKGT